MTPHHNDRKELRRAAAAMFAQAENTRDQGDLENAARLFGRSAGTWRSSGDVLEAADAYIELGSVLLSQGRGQLLPDLAARLLNLLEAKPLPEGSHLKLRVFAALIARGATNRDAVLDLALERRLGRVRVARAEGIEEHSWERGVA